MNFTTLRNRAIKSSLQELTALLRHLGPDSPKQLLTKNENVIYKVKENNMNRLIKITTFLLVAIMLALPVFGQMGVA